MSEFRNRHPRDITSSDQPEAETSDYRAEALRRIDSVCQLPADLPTTLHELPTIKALKEAIDEEHQELIDLINNPQEFEEYIAEIEEEGDEYLDSDIFDHLIRELGENHLQDESVRKYFENYAHKLGYELIAPRAKTDLVTHDFHIVDSVVGPVRSTGLHVDKCLSWGYTDNSATCIRARVIAYHPE